MDDIKINNTPPTACVKNPHPKGIWHYTGRMAKMLGVSEDALIRGIQLSGIKMPKINHKKNV